MEDAKVKAAMHTVYALALLAIAVVPASADVDLYSNGPINGTFAAWIISGGLYVSDSFVLSSAATVTGADFGAWTFPGDTVTSVQWSIGTIPYGNAYGGTAATSDTFVSSLLGAYTVDSDSFSIGNISLGAGTYYLTLQNAVTTNGSNASWDINNGPSAAYETYYGNVNGIAGPGSGSESFDVLGTTSAVTPEPGYFTLAGAAIFGLIRLKRRRVRAESQ
jgi:hypothetical protein